MENVGVCLVDRRNSPFHAITNGTSSTAGLLARGSSPSSDLPGFPQWRSWLKALRLQLRGQPRLEVPDLGRPLPCSLLIPGSLAQFTGTVSQRLKDLRRMPSSLPSVLPRFSPRFCPDGVRAAPLGPKNATGAPYRDFRQAGRGRDGRQGKVATERSATKGRHGTGPPKKKAGA